MVKFADRRTRWRLAKLTYGTVFLLLLAACFVFLRQMAVARQTLPHVDSGLMIARGLVLLGALPCLALALWGFIAAGVRLASPLARRLTLGAAAVFGVGCAAFNLWIFASVNTEYTHWLGMSIFNASMR